MAAEELCQRCSTASPLHKTSPPGKVTRSPGHRLVGDAPRELHILGARGLCRLIAGARA